MAVSATVAGLIVASGIAASRVRVSNDDWVGRSSFAGSVACAGCHPAQYQAWTSSQHAVAMQPATPGTVLGLFPVTFLHNVIHLVIGLLGLHMGFRQTRAQTPR